MDLNESRRWQTFQRPAHGHQREDPTAPGDEPHVAAFAFEVQDAPDSHLVLDPESADHQLWLGYAYLEKFESVGFFQQSSLARKIRSAYERAVDLDPDHVEARVALANYYREAPGIVGGSKKKARAQVAEILKRDPAQGHLALAELEAAEKNPAAAEREYDLALQADPGNVEAHLGLGFLNQGRERWDDAFEAFENALLADPETEEAYYQIGRTGALAATNLERAIEALQHYIDRYATCDGDLHAAAYWRLGMLHEHLREDDAATAAYRRALEIDPGFDRARKALKKLPGR